MVKSKMNVPIATPSAGPPREKDTMPPLGIFHLLNQYTNVMSITSSITMKDRIHRPSSLPYLNIPMARLPAMHGRSSFTCSASLFVLDRASSRSRFASSSSGSAFEPPFLHRRRQWNDDVVGQPKHKIPCGSNPGANHSVLQALSTSVFTTVIANLP